MLLLVHCNVMQVYFDHRHVHIARNLFSSRLWFFFFEGDNCSAHYSFNIGSFYCSGRPTAKPDLEKKKNIFKREA